MDTNRLKFGYRLLLLTVLFKLAMLVTVDVIVIVDGNDVCVPPTACETRHQNDLLNWRFTFCPVDIFAIFKTVRTLKSDVVALSSFCQPQNTTTLTSGRQPSCAQYSMDNGAIRIHSAIRASRITKHDVMEAIKDLMYTGDEMSNVIYSIVGTEEWKSYIMFTSPSQDLLHSKVYGLDFSTNEFHNSGTMRSIYSIILQDGLNFIVKCPTSCIVRFLKQAKQTETQIGKSSQWIAIPTDRFTDSFYQDVEHIPTGDIVIIDTTTFSAPWNTEVVEDTISEQYNPRTSNNRLIDITTRVLNERSSDEAQVFSLRDSKSENEVEHIGTVNTSSGNISLSQEPFPTSKYGFSGRTLTVATLEWPDFVNKKTENDVAIYTGVCMDLLEVLAHSLNFTYKIVEPADSAWGVKVDGHFNGLIGLLANKTVDLVVAPIAITLEREEVMDFTTPYFNVRSNIIIRTQDKDADKWRTLVAPFKIEVHICILFSLIFSTAVLFTMEEVNPLNPPGAPGCDARRIRFGDILWYHFGALMANGGAYLPNTQSGRSILSCWWLFTVISAAIYSGNLIAFLTDWSEKLPFTSLEAMVEQDTYKWATYGNTALVQLLEHSNETVYRKVWHGLRKSREYVSEDFEEHKRRVLAGGYAYLGDETISHNWMKEECDIRSILDPYWNMQYAVGLPNNSVYTRMFSERVLRINEVGLPRLWYNNWASHSKICEVTRTAKHVDLLAMQSAFYASGGGIAIALMVLLLECLWTRRCGEVEHQNIEMVAKDGANTRSDGENSQSSSEIAEQLQEAANDIVELEDNQTSYVLY